MQLFFQDIDHKSIAVHFERDESKHIVKVLRKNTGDTLHVTNGKGWLFTVEIISDNHNKCVGTIIERTYIEPQDLYLHVIIAPTKMNDRMEWFLEKATEIGISEITPILCDHSERKTIKNDRFERVLQSAMKQSLQFHMPKLNELTPVSDIITQRFDGQKFIAHCEDEKKRLPLQNEITSKHLTILIGPEGDFSTEEIKLALENSWLPVTLGNTRLRTETAGIVATTIANLKFSD
jgi:16S rRNA (uracil1498-N3)-methyltransferase